LSTIEIEGFLAFQDKTSCRSRTTTSPSIQHPSKFI